MREFIKVSIAKNTELVKKTAEKLQIQFNKQHKQYKEKTKQVGKAYEQLCRTFE